MKTSTRSNKMRRNNS